MSSDDIIYLDYNATTYIHEKVAKEMQPYLSTYFGNPSSSHIFGIKTKTAVQKSREQIAHMLGCSSSELIFTSGGSESNRVKMGQSTNNDNTFRNVSVWITIASFLTTLGVVIWK